MGDTWSGKVSDADLPVGGSFFFVRQAAATTGTAAAAAETGHTPLITGADCGQEML
jgi:hypothetical protein